MKGIALYCICIFVSVGLAAQHQAMFGLWPEMNEMIHPSATNQMPYTRYMINYRSQWVDVKGAPRTLSGMVGTYFNPIDLGVNVVFQRDELGNRRRNQLATQFSKVVYGRKNTRLSLGMAVLYTDSGINTDLILTPDLPPELDPQIGEYALAEPIFGYRAGVSCMIGKLDVSATMQNPGIFFSKNQDRHIAENELLVSVNYKFNLNNSLALVPFSVIYTNFINTQSTFGLKLTLEESANFGLGIRSDIEHVEAIFFGVGWEFNETFGLRYQYELGAQGISQASNGSHEFMVIGKIFDPVGSVKFRPAIWSPRML